MPPSYLSRARSRSRRRQVLEPTRYLVAKLVGLGFLGAGAVGLAILAMNGA